MTALSDAWAVSYFVKCCSSVSGRYVRNICVYGMEDLPWIIDRNSMFANKFEGATSPEALDCLEQWHRNKVLNQASVPIEPSWLLATQGNWNDSRDLKWGLKSP